MNAALPGVPAVVLAADDSRVTPGVLGFVVVALLGVATWLLIRSMNRQIKKIDIPPGGRPTRDPDAEDRSDGGPDAEPSAGAGPDGDGPSDDEPGSAQR